MTNILKCYPFASCRATNNTANHAITFNHIVWTSCQILDNTSTTDNSEDTNLISTLEYKMINHMILTIKCTNITMIIITNRSPSLTAHVNIGSKYGLSIIFTRINYLGKLQEFIGITNLVNTINTLQCKCPDTCQAKEH